MTETVPDEPGCAGLVLAAGEGARMGRPKALVVADDGEPWVARAVRVLREGGCATVTVVLGADADGARPMVPAEAAVAVAEDWAEGMGASLRTGLGALADGGAPAAVVLLVDLPDLVPGVVARLLPPQATAARTTLARAAYAGRPGHPVVLGRDHWAGVAASAVGDRGARAYLAAHQAELVECGDLAAGEDQDTPPAERARRGARGGEGHTTRSGAPLPGDAPGSRPG